MKKVLFVCIALLTCLFASGCTGGGDAVQNIDVSSSVLANFDTTVQITGVTSLMGDEPAVFKPTIRAEDITLDGGLKGKVVKSVLFINENTIEVVLSGKVTSSALAEEFATITISKRALENDTDAIDYVVVEKAKLVIRSYSGSTASGTYTATFALNAGSFSSSVTPDMVALAQGSTGMITEVSLQNGMLTVSVTGADEEPTLVLAPDLTSFNREITIAISPAGSAILE